MIDIQSTIVYLIGYPGSGKYTIAKKLNEMAGFWVVDNHLMNNVIFSLCDRDGEKVIRPFGHVKYTRRIYDAVYNAIVDTFPKSRNYVLTNWLIKDDPDDIQQAENVVQHFQKHGFRLVPVLLRVDEEELKKRVVAPERSSRMKLTCPTTLDSLIEQGDLLRPDVPETLELDITDLTPEASATAILDHIRNLP